MCGIVAIVQKDKAPVSIDELISMRDKVRHRGPDGKGLIAKEGVGIGHRHLAIVSNTHDGKQPLEYRNLIIAFNGEIYNYEEIRKELIDEGYQFTTETDTEVVAAAFHKWGHRCVNFFIGIWAFIIFDELKKELFCSRDRFGVKPLFYAECESTLYIVSEVKQLLGSRNWKLNINLEAATKWLNLDHYDYNSETLFKNVSPLPPGHNLHFTLKNNIMKVSKYYSLKERVCDESLDFNVAKIHLKQLLHKVVLEQSDTNVNLGLALSGGVDSSILSLIMANNKRPTTFSVRFKDPLIDESKYLQAILEKTNLKNIPIVPSPEEMLKVFDTVIWHLEEPPPSSSDLAHFLLFDKMHQHGIKVNICGQGADEILCGYDTFLIPYLREMKRKSKSLFLKETIRFIYLHPKTLARKLPTQIFQRFIASKSSGNPLHDKSDILGLQLSMIESLVLPFILISEDRLSMAFGIESRVPYLDHRLVEFCLSLPDSFKINNSKRKYILRECFKNQLPKLIYNRTDKIGFAAPMSKRMVDSLLTKNINIPKWLESKKTNDKMKLWRMIGLSRWMNIFGIEG